MTFEEIVGRLQFNGDLDKFVEDVYVAMETVRVTTAQDKGKPNAAKHVLISTSKIGKNEDQWETRCSCGKGYIGWGRDESRLFWQRHLPSYETKKGGQHQIKSRGWGPKANPFAAAQFIVACTCGDQFSAGDEQHALWQFHNTDHRSLLQPDWQTPILFEHVTFRPKIRRPRIVKMLEGYAERVRQHEPLHIDELMSMALSQDVTEIEGEDPAPPMFNDPAEVLFICARVLETLGLVSGVDPLLTQINQFIEHQRREMQKAMEQQKRLKGEQSSLISRMLLPGETFVEHVRVDGGLDLVLTHAPGSKNKRTIAHFTAREIAEHGGGPSLAVWLVKEAIKRLGIESRVPNEFDNLISSGLRPGGVIRMPAAEPTWNPIGVDPGSLRDAMERRDREELERRYREFQDNGERYPDRIGPAVRRPGGQRFGL